MREITRAQLLAALADRIAAQRRPPPLRVAIDGIDAAGKTELADELTAPLAARGIPVIRASLDGFHRPRTERYRRGEYSPEGYFEDAFDHATLRQALLLPLGPGGDRRYLQAVYDYRRDAPLDAPAHEAPEDAVLLVDGVFLLRPELDPHWDLRLFVDVTFDVALQRALARDAALFGSPAAVRERYLRRYLPAQRRYLQECRPRERADIVIRNDDPKTPRLTLR